MLNPKQPDLEVWRGVHLSKPDLQCFARRRISSTVGRRSNRPSNCRKLVRLLHQQLNPEQESTASSGRKFQHVVPLDTGGRDVIPFTPHSARTGFSVGPEVTVAWSSGPSSWPLLDLDLLLRGRRVGGRRADAQHGRAADAVHRKLPSKEVELRLLFTRTAAGRWFSAESDRQVAYHHRHAGLMRLPTVLVRQGFFG